MWCVWALDCGHDCGPARTRSVFCVCGRERQVTICFWCGAHKKHKKTYRSVVEYTAVQACYSPYDRTRPVLQRLCLWYAMTLDRDGPATHDRGRSRCDVYLYVNRRITVLRTATSGTGHSTARTAHARTHTQDRDVFEQEWQTDMLASRNNRNPPPHHHGPCINSVVLRHTQSFLSSSFPPCRVG